MFFVHCHPSNSPVGIHLAPIRPWDCVSFLWNRGIRKKEGWKGTAQCPGFASAQARDATHTQSRASDSSAAYTQALYHSPTVLLTKYRGASHNHRANPDCSSPCRVQEHYQMLKVDTFTSWVNFRISKCDSQCKCLQISIPPIPKHWKKHMHIFKF